MGNYLLPFLSPGPEAGLIQIKGSGVAARYATMKIYLWERP